MQNNLTTTTATGTGSASNTSGKGKTARASQTQVSITQIDRIAGLYVTGSDGQPGILVASAGRDINSQAANNSASLDASNKSCSASVGIKADIGGKLSITTLQDSSQYDSKQQTTGFSISLCVPPVCYGTSSFSANYAKQALNHSYQSANGQSGLAAGQAGYEIKVGGATALAGAALTTQNKDNSTLETTALSYTDLQNKQTTKSTSISVSISTDASAMGNLANNALGNLAGQAGRPKNQNTSSQTLSMIEGNVKLTGGSAGEGEAQGSAASQQAIATLTSRDASTANQALKNTLTLQDAQKLKEQQRVLAENAQAAQLVGSVVSNAIGDLSASMRAPYRDAQTRAALDDKVAKGGTLSTSEQQELGRLDKLGMGSEQAKNTLNDLAARANYDNWAEGSLNKIVLHGLNGIIQARIANTGGSLGAANLIGAGSAAVNEALTPAMADYLQSKGILPGTEEFKGYMQLGSALIGAGTGAVLASVSGGASSNNGGTSAIAGASVGANTAHTITTNNYLKHQEWKDLKQALDDCKKSGSDCKAVEKAYRQLNIANDNYLAEVCKDPSSAACKTEISFAQQARGMQDQLGIDDKVLGFGSQGRSNLIINQVQSQRNVAIAQTNCDAEPEKCLSTAQGAGSLVKGVVKGAVNAPGALINLVPTAIDGYGNIVQLATGNEIKPITPKVPQVAEYSNNLEVIGGVVGENVVGAGVIKGAIAVTEVAIAAQAVKVEQAAIRSMAAEAEAANAQIIKSQTVVGEQAYVAPNNTTGKYQTHGIKPDQVPASIRTQLHNDLAAGGSNDVSTALDGIIKSGSTVPIPMQATADTKLFKLVPEKYSSPTATTEYWVDQAQLARIQANPALANELFGLPPSSQVNSFNVFQMQPKPNATPTVYQSQVATTTVPDGVTNVGNATQTIVPNRNLWSTPVPTGLQIKVK